MAAEALQVKEQYLDLYAPNSDWKRREITDDFEVIKYQNDSTIRIWYNEQVQDYAEHWHNAMEIIMPVENYYDVKCGDTDIRVSPGEFVLIPPGMTHALYAPESGKRFIFLCDISYLTKMQGFSGIESLLMNPLYITKQAFPQIYHDLYQLLVQIRNEYFGNNEFRELAIYSQLINFFVLYGRNHLSNTDLFPNVRVYKQKEYMQKFRQVLEYIDDHYTEDLTLDAVADFSGFSKFHFTRLFKQYTDSTFYDYLSHKRIRAAEELLARPDLSITEIALQSGFSSISTFNRIFKQQKDCTPSEYRGLYTKINGFINT